MWTSSHALIADGPISPTADAAARCSDRPLRRFRASRVVTDRGAGCGCTAMKFKAMRDWRASTRRFLLAWHLLTKYRVNAHVRFTNIPSPAMVSESLGSDALHDSKFFMHVMLSCRRIVCGFMHRSHHRACRWGC